MRKAFSVVQAQELDRFAICRLGIPSLVLMENAGRETAQVILREFPKKSLKYIFVVCGTGNNGGDGFVVARHLLSHDFKVKVFVIGDPRSLKQDPAVYYQILKKLKCPVALLRKGSQKLSKEIKDATLIVDAIFGLGLSRPVGGPFRSVIESINRAKKIVVSVDAPSGLDADTGKVLGVCIKAARTVTFAVMKKGLLRNDGPLFAGKITVSDIGIPQGLEQKILNKKKNLPHGSTARK